ncbi:hypothetical protein GGS26DRAFT_599295 [Hypomontagnella submonticulosa]|nr:hypothetical protein GGS26DRAFT_599295 [Hypomontagnella submonticulosa]
MAELAAIGLAASILQFIDIGYSIVSSATEAYGSVSGMSTETSNLLITIRSLKQVSAQLQSTSLTMPEHASLRELSAQCQDLSEELIHILRSLRVKKKGSVRESLRVAFKSWQNQSKIKSIHKRLGDCREQIQLELILLFQNDQKPLELQLQRLLGTADEIQNDIQSLRDVIESRGVSESTDGTETIRTIRNELLGFSSTMEERFDDIKQEHNRTFSWIFNETGLEVQREPDQPPLEVCFTKWLRSGSGIFHIEGKAGSGKSTLMKFLCDNPQTTDILRSWAGEKQLVFGKFFFWKPGTPMQRSLKGLTQALLHSILKQAPDLIEFAFSDEYNQIYNKPWDLPCDGEISIDYRRIQSQFEQLLASESACQSRRFCFFIDGLDEFDESNGQDANFMIYQRFVETISTWTTAGADVKLCVSSRDWNLFRNVLDGAIPGSPGRRLLLQELTRDDMMLTVKDTLAGVIGSHDTEPQFIELANEIVKRAEGVFLWVTLVLTSLLRGKQFDDSPAMLRKRLDEFPTGLDDFFRFMMNGIERPYRQLAVNIFSVSLTIRKICPEIDATPLMYSFLEDLEGNSNYTPRDGMSDEDLQRRIEHMRSQLVACCRGLLEVRQSKDIFDQRLPGFVRERVVFLHRSVPEFFEGKPDSAEGTGIHSLVQESITNKASRADTLRLICLSFLAEIKSLRARHSEYLYSYEAGTLMTGLVLALHEVYQEGKPPDFDILNALDLVLRFPNPDVPSPYSPQTRTICYFGTTWACTFLDGGGGLVYDLFGTFALYGFGEILPLVLEPSQDPISQQRLDSVLSHVIGGFCCIIGSRHGHGDRLNLPTDVSGHVDLIHQLLRRGVDPNSNFKQNELLNITLWRYFIAKTIMPKEEKSIFPDKDVMGLFKLFLQYGADPFAWCTTGGKLRFWFQTNNGLVAYNPNEDAEDDHAALRVISLRCLLEGKSQESSSSGDVLKLLPSQTEYERRWKNSVMNAYIRPKK